LLQTILESIAEGILAIDTDGNVLCMNQQFRQQWNLPDQVFTEHSQRVTFKHNQFTDAQAFLEQLQWEVSQPNVESRSSINLKDGRTLERYSKPLQMGNDIIGRVISNRDITEQKRSQAALAESEQLLRTVVTQTPTILYAIDRQGFFTLGEGKGLEVAGLRSGELVGQSAFEFYADYPHIIEHLHQVLAGEEHSAVLEFNGVIYDNRATPLRNPQGEIIGLMGVATDVTARRQAEKALRQAKEDLEQRVAERTAALQAANHKLQQEITQRTLIEQNLREKQAGLRLLNRISTGLTAGLSADQLVELVVEETAQVFPEVRVLYGVIENRYFNVLHSAQPKDMPALKGYLRDFHLSQTYLDAIAQNQPIIVEDVWQEPWLAVSAPGMIARKTRALIIIPVQHSEQSRGLLCMNATQPIQWRSCQIETLQEVANYLSIVLQKARAQQEQQQAEERLRLFESVVVNGNDAVIITDANYQEPRIVYTNAAFTEVTGYSAEEVLGKTPHILRGSKTDRAQLDEIKAALRQGQPIQTELINYHKDGSEFWADLNIVPITDTQGKVAHFVALQRDITDRKWSEKALIATQARLKYLLSSNPSVIYTCQPNSSRACTFVSENITQQLGYEIWQYLKDPQFWMAHIHPDDLESIRETLDRVSTVGEATCEYRFLHQKGHYCWLRDDMKLLRDPQGHPVEMIGSVVDISDRKWAEDQIRTSLQEKEVMLKEIHHRVKNNLQVISSLLKLQVGHIDDDRISVVLKESQNRVRAMALIHEKLYQSDDLAKTDFAAYIRRLSYDLFRSYSVNSRGIQLNLAVEDVRLSIDTAIPCGLIINELVSNSLKYAFSGLSCGEISIQLHANPGSDEYQLIVQDNGSGFPTDLDFRNTRSLGLQLVCNLTKQLQGTITLDRSAGTRFTISFAEPKPRG
jgi:PAS domain S-box-containing protein